MLKVSDLRRALLFLGLWLAACISGSAGVDLTSVQKKALLNGLEVYFLPPRDPAISQFVLMVRNGAAFDPAGKPGVTHLMAEMLLRGGTKSRSAELIRRDLEKTGARVQSTVEWDAIFFHGEIPRSGVQPALSILAELLIHPDLTEEGFHEEQRRVLEALREEADLEHRTQQVFQSELFQLNPYGQAVEGTISSVEDLTLMDVKIQYRRLMLPNQAQLALFFDDADNRLFLSMGRPWGGWVRSDPAPFTFRRAEPATARRVLLIDSPGPEALVRLGGLTVSKSDRSYYPLEILEHYLTLSLPVWAREIEDSGQIRGSVSLRAMTMPGTFQINLRIPASRVGDYLDRCLRALSEIAAGRLDQKRYREARELAFLELKNTIEEPAGQLFELLKANLYSQGISYLVNYGLRLERVQKRHLIEVIGTTLRADSLLIVVAGPAAEMETNLGRFGPVEILN